MKFFQDSSFKIQIFKSVFALLIGLGNSFLAYSDRWVQRPNGGVYEIKRISLSLDLPPMGLMPSSTEIIEVEVFEHSPPKETSVVGDILYLHGFGDNFLNHLGLFDEWAAKGFRIISFHYPKSWQHISLRLCRANPERV